MIQISDKVLPFLTKITKNELMLYVMIMRYISEEKEIPFEKIQKLTSFSSEKLVFTLKSLIDKKLVFLSLRNLDLIDLIGEKKQKFLMKTFLQKKLADIIYNTNKDNSKDNSNKSYRSIKKISNKSNKYKIRSSFYELNKNQRALTVTLKNKLLTITRAAVKQESIDLVNYLSDALYHLHGIPKTRDWRLKQLAIAKRLLNTYKYTLKEWKEAVDYFKGQEFWQDKLNSLKQIENNLHQFIAKFRQAKQTNTKIKKIK
jgi:hypothetical protein